MKKKVREKLKDKKWYDYFVPIMSLGIIVLILYVFCNLTTALMDTKASILEPYIIIGILLWFIFAKQIFKNMLSGSIDTIDEFFNGGEDEKSKKDRR